MTAVSWMVSFFLIFFSNHWLSYINCYLYSPLIFMSNFQYNVPRSCILKTLSLFFPHLILSFLILSCFTASIILSYLILSYLILFYSIDYRFCSSVSIACIVAHNLLIFFLVLCCLYCYTLSLYVLSCLVLLCWVMSCFVLFCFELCCLWYPILCGAACLRFLYWLVIFQYIIL